MKKEYAITMRKLGFIKRATYKGKPTKKAENLFKIIQGMTLATAKYNIS